MNYKNNGMELFYDSQWNYKQRNKSFQIIRLKFLKNVSFWSILLFSVENQRNPDILSTNLLWTFSMHYSWENFIKRTPKGEGNFSDFCSFDIFLLKNHSLKWIKEEKIPNKILIFQGLGVQSTFPKFWGSGRLGVVCITAWVTI